MYKKNIIVTGISLLTAAGMLVLTPGAHAQFNSTSFVNSGDNANVSSESNTRTNLDVNLHNISNIRQDIDVAANTGHNDSSGNIGDDGGSSITTGDTHLNAGLAVQANRNNVALSGIGQNSGVNFTDVINTGDDSDINSSTDTRTNVDVNNKNISHVRQDVNAYLNSGHNSSDDNIGGSGGEITTGSAMTHVGMEAALNHNRVGISLDNSGNGSMSSSMNDSLFTNTGDGFNSDTSIRSRTDISMRSINHMNAKQRVSVDSNTGWNNSDDNIGGSSSLMSGNAGVTAGSSIMGNLNNTFLGDIMDRVFDWVSM